MLFFQRNVNTPDVTKASTILFFDHIKNTTAQQDTALGCPSVSNEMKDLKKFCEMNLSCFLTISSKRGRIPKIRTISRDPEDATQFRWKIMSRIDEETPLQDST